MGVHFGCMHPPKALFSKFLNFSKNLEYFSYLYRAERIRPQGDMGGGNLGSQILEVRFSKDCRKTIIEFQEVFHLKAREFVGYKRKQAKQNP